MLKTKDGYAKVIGTSYQGSSDYVLLSNGGGKAISSLSVNYAFKAGSVTWDSITGKPSSFTPSAHNHDGRYLRLDGSDTMTGVLKVKGNQYNDGYDGAINMNNSDIYGLNSIYTADKSDSQAEGIHFWRDATHVDTLRMMDGNLLFTPNRPLGGSGTEQTVLHTGNSSVSGHTITINGTSTTWSNSWRPIGTGASDAAAGNHTHKVKINGSEKTIAATGVTDLGTYLTAHQSLSGYVNTISTIGGGNAVTSISKVGNAITVNKGTTFLTSHQSLANYYTKGQVDTKLGNYLPLSGGTMDAGAQIQRTAKGGMWYQGRSIALLRETSAHGYHALWSLKTTDGSWDFGEYNSSDWNNIPVLSYVLDSNFNKGSNTTTYQIKFPLASGTIALTSQIPTSLPANGGNADTVDGKHASDFATAGHRHDWSQIDSKPATATRWPTWAEVTGKPTIPSVGNGTITIAQTGNTNQTFTVNQSGNKTITLKDTNTWRPITDNYELGESGTSLSSLGSLTLYNDLLDSIPNPTNYYWANNKISSTSTTGAKVQLKAIGVGCAASIDNSIIATNWIRTTGKTGLYFQDYAGGLYMSDDTWIRTWNSKALQVDNTIRSKDFNTTYYANNVWTITSAAKLESATDLVYGTDTSSKSINTYLRGTTVTLQVKNGTSINYNALQLTSDRINCNNYCDMKQGAAVSGGNLTVQNNSYLAQKADAKVGIGTSSPSCLLDVSGLAKVNQLGIWGTPDANTQLYVNGRSKLLDLYLNAYRNEYFKQPVCLEFITFKNYAINSTIWSSPKSSKTNDVVVLEIPNLSVPDKYKVFVFVTSANSPNIYATITQTAPLLINIVTGGVSINGLFAVMIWAIPT